MRRLRFITSAAVTGAIMLFAGIARPVEQPIPMPTDDEIRKMTEAMPGAPTVEPAKPRKALVVGWNAAHLPVPYAAKAVEIMAKKTAAFEAVFSADPTMFEPEKLAQFDAVIMNNLHGYNPLLPPNFKQLPKEEQETAREREAARRQSLVDFVKSGKGLVGIHGCTVGLYDWPEYGKMIGGYFADWPWKGKTEVPIKIEEPGHPLNAAFGGQGFTVVDEIYQFKDPYSRENLRVLLSVDLSKTTDLGSRPDKDYAVSWVQNYGQGRVFYSALGHNPDLYWNPKVLRHYLDGIQFAIGDLKADTTPSAKLKKQ